MPRALSENTIAIVLSTYNGEKYIKEQLDALIAQSHQDWRCYLRDDGSKDTCPEIIRVYADKDSRFIVIDSTAGNLGLNSSHYYLTSLTKENYIAMCDQDDVWGPQKLEFTLRKLKQIETEKKMPALVHTDSVLVDSNLNVISSLFVGKRGCRKGIEGILFANSVQGGSIMINKSLKDIVLKIPPVLPYDYHWGIISELVGVRGFLPAPLLKYRQHSFSSIATSNANRSSPENGIFVSSSLLLSLSNYKHMKEDFTRLELSPPIKRKLDDYFYLFDGVGWLKKLLILARYRYPFSRRRDFVAFAILLIRNLNLNLLLSR